MSGVLEQAIQYLQTQQQAMQSMMGSGGGSFGGIGDFFPQTPITGGGQTQSVSQPSTMEVPTPPVTAPPVATTTPVTNTTPVSTPPAPVSTPVTPTTSLPPPVAPSSLGDLINSSAGRSQQTPQERFVDSNIDLGFFDSDEYTQSQQGPQTSDMGYTSGYGFGSGLSSSGGRAQDQAYEAYLNRTGQGDMITREQIAPTTPQLPAFQQNLLDQINQIGIPRDTSASRLGIAGLGQMEQRQALPAQQFVSQAQPSSMAGMNLGVGLNPMFGRAFAGKPI